MTNLEKLAEKKALELLNAVCDDRRIARWTKIVTTHSAGIEALYNAVLAHETYRREVSDAIKAVINSASGVAGLDLRDALARFVVVEEDPLVELCDALDIGPADYFRGLLAERGLKIVEAD